MRLAALLIACLVLGGDVSRAEVRCDDPPVLAVVADVFKCQELVTCAGDSWGALNSAKAIETASDEVISREVESGMATTLRNYQKIGTPAATEFGKSVVQATQNMVSALRDFFPSIQVSAKAIDYEPNRRRYTCQANFRFNDAKFQQYAKYQGLMVALANQTMVMIIQARLSDGNDPRLIVNRQAQINAAQLNCLSRTRTYSLQPTIGQEFIVTFDNATYGSRCG